MKQIFGDSPSDQEIIDALLEANSRLSAEKSPASALEIQIRELEKLHATLASEAGSPEKDEEHLAKLTETLMQALRKQLGESEPVPLDKPEPRQGRFRRMLKTLFRDQGALVRNQGALNKYLISAMRYQLHWNTGVNARMKAVEEFSRKLCLQLIQAKKEEIELQNRFVMSAESVDNMSPSAVRIQHLLGASREAGKR